MDELTVILKKCPNEFDDIKFWLPEFCCWGKTLESKDDDKMGKFLSNDGIEYFLFDEEEASDLIYAYGYALTLDSLKIMFPEIEDKEELANSYFTYMKDKIFITYKEEGNIGSNYMSRNELAFYLTDPPIEVFEGLAMMPIEYLENWHEQIAAKDFTNLTEDFNKTYKIIKDSNFMENIFDDSDDDIENMNISEDEITILADEIMASINTLNNLVGLANVKKEVNSWFSYINFFSKVKDFTNLEYPNMHMVFYGNPGTGKTTVARILANVLYCLGFIENKKLIEITPSDCISNHIGETAIKTKNLLKENRGSVIFIDEAYAFSLEHNSFAEEALVEILKELERHESVLIFAGYHDRMKEFIKMNPGLASRIRNYYQFEDYSVCELVEIWQRKLKKHGFDQTSEVNEIVFKILDQAKRNPHFGNGRYIDNLFDQILMNHAINTKDIEDKEELLTFNESDIEGILEKEKNKEKQKTIGFTY